MFSFPLLPYYFDIKDDRDCVCSLFVSVWRPPVVVLDGLLPAEWLAGVLASYSFETRRDRLS